MQNDELRMMNKRLKRIRGFSLVEVLLSIAVFLLLAMGLVSAILYGEESTALAGKQARAMLLAKEGLEAVRSIRDADFANLSAGTHGLATTGGAWTLSGSSDTEDIYTRSVTLTQVDANTFLAESQVTWDQNLQRSGTIILPAYFTYWQESVSGGWGAPSLAGTFNIPGNSNGFKIAVSGDYAYLTLQTGSGSNFFVIDISDSDNPTVAGSANANGTPYDVAISGNYAFVTSNSNTQELQVFNISNPASPTLADTLNLSGNNDARGIFIEGSVAYIARASGDLHTINISNPTNVSELDRVDFGGSLNDVVVFGGNAYAASSDNGSEFKVINVSNPSSISLRTSYNLSGNSNAMSIAAYPGGNAVFVGRSGGDFASFDVSNPASPSLEDTFNAQNTVNDIAVSDDGTRAFLGTNDNSLDLQIVDVSDTGNMSLEGSLDTNGNVNGVAYHSGQGRVFAVTDSDSEEMIVVGN